MPETVSAYRNITYRLLPGSRSNAKQLAGLAGACRFVWNAILAEQSEAYKKAKEAGEKPPSVSFFSLGKRFTALRRTVEWLPEYSFGVVRYTLKYQADAWKAFFKEGKRRPRFHSRRGSTPSFTIPDNVRVRDGKLYIPKVGYMALRRRGGNPYPDGIPIKATVKKNAGKGYAVICYKIEAPVIEDTGSAVGIDRNCGQIAMVSTEGDTSIIRQPDTKRLDAKLKRHQRRLARQKKGSNRRNRRKHRIARIQRKRANILKNANHQVSRSIANCSSTVILEDLKIKAMTRSAKGTMESFGTNVRQKSGLNRGILRTGWGQLDQMLGYKCRKVIKVTAAYTSQRCFVCGHTEASNRKTQSTFTCMSCGHADHADLNAAANILASGIGASARRGAFGLPTPMTREIDTSASLCTVGHSRI